MKGEKLLLLVVLETGLPSLGLLAACLLPWLGEVSKPLLSELGCMALHINQNPGL
jgi:hypothetical protein